MASKQVVLITGASTGFGRLMTETLARQGHTVFATMRDPAVKNARNASELRALAGKENLSIEVLELDVTDESSADRAARACVDKAGRIDVAINNAGYVLVGLLEANTVEQVRQIFDTNFLGCVRVDRAVLPFMRKQRSGLLMHISSGAGRIVFPGFGMYCATKFAMEALSESYSYELAGQGIESVVLEPGAYRTPVFSNVVTAADRARTETYGPAAQIPDKLSAALDAAAGNPQEIADAVLSIIETAAGQRERRYTVGTRAGVEQINALSAQTQSQVLQNFGITADTTFTKQSAASAD